MVVPLLKIDGPNGSFEVAFYEAYTVYEYHQERSPVAFRQAIPWYPSLYSTALTTCRGGVDSTRRQAARMAT